LKIPYKVFPDQHGAYLYSATLPVSIALPARNSPRTKRFEAIIDSGATRCLFHSDLARHLGLDIKAGILEKTNGIGGEAECYLHDIFLYIPGGPVLVTAAFKENLPVIGLLGMNGFFEHFLVKFDSAAEACELERVYKT
jgi:hypothetical protein